MKINNIVQNLTALKERLSSEIMFINQTLNMIEKQLKETRRCPNCFSANTRFMKNKQIYCASCGYDSRLKQNSGEQDGKK